MKFDNFRFNLVLRLLALITNIFVLLWGYLNTGWQMTLLVSLTLLLIQTFELVYFVEKTNRQFGNFLDSICERDFSTRFKAHENDPSFAALALAYNRITNTFLEINSERAANHQLLEALIEHISVALLCIDEHGKIIFLNQAAKKLFKAPHLNHHFALSKIDAQLPSLLEHATTGESQLVRLVLDNELFPLSMFTTKFGLLDKVYSLVSFQNIRDELESRELDSWQKLIKVLTHEIMNSVTPIVSLASVIKQSLVNDVGQLSTNSLSAEEAQDLVRSLLAIETRGKGLVRFVQTYNDFANPPKPNFTMVGLAGLLERVNLLMRSDLEVAGINLRIRCELPNLCLHADAQQLEQVLINLVKNAKEALYKQQDGTILITACERASRGVQISVIDNGPGIAPDKLQDIFVPFYTSKKQGSGIGLSISRQLMLANKGYITVNSQPGVATEFILVFRPHLESLISDGLTTP